jgi:hypothetical protein
MSIKSAHFLGLSVLALTHIGSAGSLNVYISSPGTQSTFLAGATTETFDLLANGNRSVDYVSAIGTYNLTESARFNIQDANLYGGADDTQYMAFGAQSSSADAIDLDLNGSYSYFGFWWSAGDPLNGLSFYHDGHFQARFATADITLLLSPSSGPTVTAINGATYSKSSYRGNPNNGQNGAEAYAYVHIIAQGTTFNRIVFDNSESTGSGFESDNHSVIVGHVVPDGGTVLVREVPAEAATPEAGTLFLMGTGLVAAGVVKRSRWNFQRN